MKEFVDKEKTQEEKAKVRPKPSFNQGDDAADKAIDKEEDLSLGIINMIGGPYHPDLESRI